MKFKKFKIGRFDAYKPDCDLDEILLKILSMSFSKKGDSFDSSTDKLYRFFFDLKREYPTLFEHVHFNHDPEFPYSKEVTESFIGLQEYGYLDRPNPSLNRYCLNINLDCKRPEKSSKDYILIKKIAEKFKKEFSPINKNENCESL